MSTGISTRETIYRQLRAALLFKGPLRLPEFKPREESEAETLDIANLFAGIFTENGGEFYLAHNNFDGMDAVLRIMEKNNWKKAFTISNYWREQFQEIESEQLLTDNYAENFDVILAQADFAYAWQGLIGFNAEQSGPFESVSFAGKPIIWLLKSSNIYTNLGEGMQQSRHRYGRKLPACISLWRPTANDSVLRLALVLHQVH